MPMEHSCNQGDRFDRLEAGQHIANLKLDKITDLLVAQAEANGRIESLEKSRDDHETRLRAQEACGQKTTLVLSWGERSVIFIVATLVSFWLAKHFGAHP